MGGKARGMGHAIREWQFAQAQMAQSRGTAGIGSLPNGVRVAAPLSIDMLVSEYERRFDRRYAKEIRDLLHELAKERADRTNVLPKKAFRDVREALQNRFKLGEYGTLYLLAAARMAGIRPATLEEALAFMNGFVTRTHLDRFPENERFHVIWTALDGSLRLFRTHIPCVGMGNMKPDAMLRSLDLWLDTGLHVAPCHAMRLVHVADRAGLDVEVVAALAREHGAERLDDLVRLIEEGTLTAENVWEFQTRPDLVRALTFGQIDWLLREWRANPSTDLLAFAQGRRRDLRKRRGKLFAGTRPTPILAGTVERALASVYRETTAEERAKSEALRVLITHEKTCGRESWMPGAYVPSDDAILGSAFECPPALGDGLARRTSRTGDPLEELAERVCRIVGDAAPDRILFAFDLLAEWEGEADPALCLRAATAAKRAHIPDSLAFDLLAQFGRDHAEEAVGLVEDGLVGLKECQRLLKYPVLIVERRGRMRGLLERYREAGSPADIYAFAHRRPGSPVPRWPKPERTGPTARVSLRNDAALRDPARYLTALDAAEARPRDIVVVPPDPDPVPEAHAANPAPVAAPSEAPAEKPPAERPAPVTVTCETPADGPLLRLMREIGDDLATEAVARAWDGLVALFPRHRAAEIAEALEPILVRMVRVESREQSKKKVPREDCYNNVIYGTFFDPGVGVDDTALSVLLSFEKAGLSFPTHQEFRAFYLGISARIGHAAGDRTFGGEALRTCDLLCEHLLVHLPHLSDADRAAVIQSADTLLTGIDLFADAGGKTPLCKCLRIAVGLRRRQVGRQESFWLFRMFAAERADDLIALIESRRVRTRDLDRLFQRPEMVAERALDDLVNLLAA